MELVGRLHILFGGEAGSRTLRISMQTKTMPRNRYGNHLLHNPPRREGCVFDRMKYVIG